MDVLLDGWRQSMPESVPSFDLITHSIPLKSRGEEGESLSDNEQGSDSDVDPVGVDDEHDIETFPCDCTFDPGVAREKCACGPFSKCMNRELFIECNPVECPAGINCQNQRFQKLQYAQVKVVACGDKGHGLVLLEDLKPGDFVMEYVGELLNKRQFMTRVRKAEKTNQRHFYFMTIKNGTVIDASEKGNLARFMNHSCAPNCETQKWTVGGKLRVGLFAKQSIKSGTELTFDYKFVRFGQAAQKCLCGEPNCKGFIGEEPKNDRATGLEQGADDIESICQDTDAVIGLDKIPNLVKALLRSDEDNIESLLGALLRVESEECYRQFMHFHGLKVLASLHIPADSVNVFLQVLRVLPLVNRQQLDDSGLEEVARKLVQGSKNVYFDDLLSHWSSLSTEYRIPRVNSIPSASIGKRHPDDPLTLDAPDYLKKDRKAHNTNKGAIHPKMQTKREPRSAQYSERLRSPSPQRNLHIDLPPNWKTAISPEGQIYYYNEITKQTSWDPPGANLHGDRLSFEQACKIIDNSPAVARLGRALDTRSRAKIANDFVEEFKDSNFTDLTTGRHNQHAERFISENLYNLFQGR